MVMVCCSSVNGRWVSAESGSSFPVLDPLTGSEVGRVPDMTSEDCQLAISAASQAFSSWQHTTAKGDISRLGSHWSSSYITALSLVENFTVMK